MASEASCSSSSASASSTSLSPSPLLRLPSVLFEQVCGCLPAKELLRHLAATGKATRELLTPGCFATQQLVVGSHELKLLSSLPPSPFGISSFHLRLLSRCLLHIGERDLSLEQILALLPYFPACSRLHVSSGYYFVSPAPLLALLRSPTAVSCSDLALDGFFVRERASKGVPAKRKRPFDSSWGDIRLPSLTRLSLTVIADRRPLRGGAAFLANLTALTHLTLSLFAVPVEVVTRLFEDGSALPQLAEFTLCDKEDWEPSEEEKEEEEMQVYDLVPLLTALATTAVRVDGGVRPTTELSLEVATQADVFAAAALMQGLTSLKVSRANSRWLDGWADAQRLPSAFAQLQYLDVSVRMEDEEWAERKEAVEEMDRPAVAAGLASFLQAMAARPLQALSLSAPQLVALDAAVLAQFARLHRLRELTLSALHPDELMHWDESSLFASWTAGCLPCLRSLALQTVQLTAGAMVTVASAAPRLRKLELSDQFEDAKLSCHPAVICAIIGGCCAEIETLHIYAQCWGEWASVQAADVAAAYQSALAATGREEGYRPFTQLRQLHLKMCTCAPPSVWHALLALMRAAGELRSLVHVTSDDPLSVSALAYLPSLTELSGSCQWPLSFPVFVHRVEGRAPPRSYLDTPLEQQCSCTRHGRADRGVHPGAPGGAVPARPVPGRLRPARHRPRQHAHLARRVPRARRDQPG